MSKPQTVIRPSSGRSSPARSRSSVVLPAPSGPTRPVTWPGSIARAEPIEGRRRVAAEPLGDAARPPPAVHVATAASAGLCIEADGDRHPLPQAAVGVVDDDPQPVDQVGAQLARLDRLGREFGGRRDEPDVPLVDLAPARNRSDIRGHFGLDAAQVRLVDISPDPDGGGQGQREDGLAGRDDRAALAGAGEDLAGPRRDQLAVGQPALGLADGRLLGPELGAGRVDVLLARADLGQPQTPPRPCACAPRPP